VGVGDLPPTPCSALVVISGLWGASAVGGNGDGVSPVPVPLDGPDRARFADGFWDPARWTTTFYTKARNVHIV
jgi:hypothetical protein